MFRKLVSMLANALWLVPGLLMWAAFPPLGEKMDVVFGLAPLLWLARRGNRRKATLVWLANGAAFWLASLSWMPAIVKNGGPAPLVALGWFALAAYCALYFGAFGWLSSTAWLWARRGAYWRRLAMLAFVEPVLWAGLELLRSRLFGGFAWNHVGVPAVNAGFADPAALGGVYLVGALVVLVAGTIASIAERMFAGLDRMKTACAAPKWLRSIETFLPLALAWGVFAASVRTPAATPRGSSLSVALVQPNLPCVFDTGDRADPLETFSRLLEGAAPLRPDLVVLAESAFGEFGAVGSARAGEFARLAAETTGAKAVLGGGARRDAERRLYNCAALYSGDTLQIYDKVHLVPFGEFIPFDKTFTSLQRLAPVGSCTPGELKTLELDGVRLGVAICYEDTDSAHVRRLAELGARLLVFITNDAWFSRSEETVQHAWQAVARAVETGLPVVRVGNSGVTGAISPSGVATWLADENGRPRIDARGVMVERVAPAAPDAAPTPYVRFGDKPLAIAFAVLAAMILSTLRPRRPQGTAAVEDEILA